MDRLKTIEEFRNVLTELRGRNVLVKRDLGKIATVIDKDSFAPLDDLKAWGEDLIAWLTKSADCHELHSKLFNKPLPDKISAAEAALDAEEKKIHETIILGQAEEFMLFLTEDVELSKVLREHQAKLKKLLASKRRDDKLKAAIEPYAKFVRAAQEKNSVEKFALSDGLRAYFSNDLIWHGIFGGELTMATLDADKPVEAPKKKIAPPTPPAESDFVKILQSKRALLSDKDFDRWRGIFNIDKVERNKPCTAINFKRDFKSGKTSETLKLVLYYIEIYGILSPTSFYPKNVTLNILQNAIQLLHSKGYIQKYTFEGYGSFYSFTKTFYDLLKSDEGKKLLRPKPPDKWDLNGGAFVGEDMKCALTRLICCLLYEKVNEDKNHFYRMDFFAQAFHAEFDLKDDNNLFIGCFWDTADECDRFIKNLAAYLKHKNFARVFVAGLTFAQTMTISDALAEVLADVLPKDADYYLYAFNDNTFYNSETGEPVMTEEILAKSAPDAEDDFWADEDFDDNEADTDDSEPEDDSAEPVEEPDVEEPFDEPEVEIVETEPDIYEPEVYDFEEPADEDDYILHEVKGLLLSEKFYCATAYLKARSAEFSEVELLYRQVAFALDDPLLDEPYSAAAISTLFAKDNTPFNETLIIAAALRAFFYNDVEFDYDIPALFDALDYFELLDENIPLYKLISDVKDFKIANRKGANYFVDSVAKNRRAAVEFGKVISDAATYYRQFFEGDFRGETGYTTVKTKQKLFDINNDFGATFKLMKAPIEKYTPEALSTVKGFLAKNFIRKEAALNIDNIDSDKLLDWVERCWNEVKSKKNKNSMVGDRRSNLISSLERAGAIMCTWVKCAENLTGAVQDGRHAETFANMARKSEEAYKELGKKLKGKSLDTAGFMVLARTLKEISARLGGSYDAAQHKYFYVQFLCGDYVILDENYLPRLDLNISDGTGDALAEQILKHADSKLPSVEKRIEHIFQKHGDDFGSAQMLDDYLKATTGESFIAKKNYALKECIAGVGKDVERKLEEFKGGVELAQIHGQLNSDDVKEKILRVVDNCCAYAKASGNYGVFFRVKKFWEEGIKRNATEFEQLLEDDLQRATEDFKQHDENFDSAALAESVEEIQKLLTAGNFAAARTLISELSRGKPYKKPVGENLTLSRFIDDYGECYGKVQNIGTSLKNLLAKQSVDKNKFYKARGELIDSWLPNGMPDSTGGKEKYLDRVGALLELLGFDVDSLTLSDDTDTKSLTFTVKLKKSFQMMHTHPIAAFGSEAEVGKAGFRVTCLFGQFPQENLIDYFKKLDAGNTLILLDHALKLPERRRLARAIKSDRSLMHIFAVVDRVDIMYLIKNCSEQIGTKRINDTLMSLIMPFSRCQPYIWDPQKLLPPEMFIGREDAMYNVKNPDGVNIVYGGRQLGKSALLKMACREIDGNKNQRAIYVELSGGGVVYEPRAYRRQLFHGAA